MAQQALPDPEFPTVGFPNPEEGAGVLDLAFATAEARGLTLVLANDPDADRFAAAERDNTTGASTCNVVECTPSLTLCVDTQPELHCVINHSRVVQASFS